MIGFHLSMQVDSSFVLRARHALRKNLLSADINHLEKHLTKLNDRSITGAYENRTEDINGDGLVDFLAIGVNVTAIVSGSYTVAGSLRDLNGTVIGDACSYCFLNSSDTFSEVFLNFQGLPIYQHSVDGPYTLTHLVLYDDNGTLMDNVEDACNTSAYTHTDFTTIPEYPTLILTAFGMTTVTAVAMRRKKTLKRRQSARSFLLYNLIDRSVLGERKKENR